jgi:hypothetical protein
MFSTTPADTISYQYENIINQGLSTIYHQHRQSPATQRTQQDLQGKAHDSPQRAQAEK